MNRSPARIARSHRRRKAIERKRAASRPRPQQRFIDEFLALSFPPGLVEAGDRYMAASERLAKLAFPMTEEERAESKRVALERGWTGQMPWERGT